MKEMTKQEKINFVIGLTKNVSDRIVEKIEAGKVPDNWDGYELRLLIRDKMAEVVWCDAQDGRQSKNRQYKNIKRKNNL